MRVRNINTLISKLPKGVYFGCDGHVMTSSCGLCNIRQDKIADNYNKYIYKLHNYKKMGLIKKPSEIKGFYVFIQKETENSKYQKDIFLNYDQEYICSTQKSIQEYFGIL